MLCVKVEKGERVTLRQAGAILTDTSSTITTDTNTPDSTRPAKTREKVHVGLIHSLLCLSCDHSCWSLASIGHVTALVGHVTTRVGHVTTLVDHVTTRVGHVTTLVGHVTMCL